MSVNEQLAEGWHKPVNRKLKKRHFQVRFKQNIWASDKAEMESLSLKNKNILCVIDVFTKYTWVY